MTVTLMVAQRDCIKKMQEMFYRSEAVGLLSSALFAFSHCPDSTASHAVMRHLRRTAAGILPGGQIEMNCHSDACVGRIRWRIGKQYQWSCRVQIQSRTGRYLD